MQPCLSFPLRPFIVTRGDQPSFNPWSNKKGATRELPFYAPQAMLPVLLSVVMGFQHSLSIVRVPCRTRIPSYWYNITAHPHPQPLAESSRTRQHLAAVYEMPYWIVVSYLL